MPGRAADHAERRRPTARQAGHEELAPPRRSAISTVMPRSGCITSKRQRRRRAAAWREDVARQPARSARLCDSSQARRSRRPGFRNSRAAAIDSPASETQRRAPLTSTPMTSVATISTSTEARASISARRRISRATRKEMASISVEGAGTRKKTWRLAKMEGDRGRCARRPAGEAASDRTMPATHQRHQRRQQPAVDGPPPFAENGCDRRGVPAIIAALPHGPDAPGRARSSWRGRHRHGVR